MISRWRRASSLRATRFDGGCEVAGAAGACLVGATEPVFVALRAGPSPISGVSDGAVAVPAGRPVLPGGRVEPPGRVARAPDQPRFLLFFLAMLATPRTSDWGAHATQPRGLSHASA